VRRANTRIPQALSARGKINAALTTHFYVIELGEYASIKTKCFPIRADERRFFNLIARRFMTPVAGAWGSITTRKIDALSFRRCVSVAGKHHHGGEYQAGPDERSV
jgi:hypothetical protein